MPDSKFIGHIRQLNGLSRTPEEPALTDDAQPAAAGEIELGAQDYRTNAAGGSAEEPLPFKNLRRG